MTPHHSGPIAMLSQDGTRLHLHHGPIDLIIGADPAPARPAAFAAAEARFQTVLEELVAELPQLRQPHGAQMPPLKGRIAQRMVAAIAPLARQHFVTPMAAVAGAVADEVLSAMRQSTRLLRAYVNNGGDIALHLAPGAHFDIRLAALDGQKRGALRLTAADQIGGIATSGSGGRSLSLGIAESVTTLARTAAGADAAATLIANAVDLPDHPRIARSPAEALQPDSDLGARLVVTSVPRLSAEECALALSFGAAQAHSYMTQGHIKGAALFLQGQSRLIEKEIQAHVPVEHTQTDADDRRDLARRRSPARHPAPTRGDFSGDQKPLCRTL